MIPLPSQKYEKQGALLAPRFRANPPVKQNFTALYCKALKTKIAKQSENGTECHVYGLKRLNKQVERYKPKLIIIVNFSSKNLVKLF